jgi:hypothetical protein
MARRSRFAIYMITSTRCGVSAMMLEREIGVSYKATGGCEQATS